MSQILLTQALRHLPPWLIFDVGRVKTHADDNIIPFPTDNAPETNGALRFIHTIQHDTDIVKNPAKALYMLLSDWDGIPKKMKAKVLDKMLDMAEAASHHRRNA